MNREEKKYSKKSKIQLKIFDKSKWSVEEMDGQLKRLTGETS